jgi:UDP-glucose 4-epimerase
MTQHILITGGTGLVGSEIVNKLLQAGFSLTLVSRRPPRVSSGQIRWVCVDLATETDADTALRDIPAVDAVVHAAAVLSDEGDTRSLSALFDTNLRAGDLLFRWCGERGVSCVVLIGSLSVLRRPLQIPISESHPLGPATPYAMSKLWNEEQLRRRAYEYGFTPIVLRISSPIPSTLEALPSTVVKIWLEASLRNEPLKVFGSGARTQDFVACADVAEAAFQSLQSPGASGVYHIGSGVPLSMRDLARTIADFRSTPIVFEGVDPQENDRWELSLERARRDLGYLPKWTGLQAIASLARTVL